MSNRAFGVEIECYSPEGDSEAWSENGVQYTADLLRKNGYNGWANLVTDDSSLYAEDGGFGVEIKSPILVGSEGFSELTKVMKLLQMEDYFIDDDCGLHIHLNTPEVIQNKKLAIKVVKAWMRNQHLVDNMVADSRLNNSHCEPWDGQSLYYLEECLREWGDLEDSHRGSINVGSLERHGTIEIRQHEGTLDPMAAISWIKFCQAFVDTVLGATVQKIGSEELFLKRLKVERNASRFLSTKARLAKQRRTEVSS